MYGPVKYYDYAYVKRSRGESDGDNKLFSLLKEYEIKVTKITSHENVYKVFTPNSNYAFKKVGNEAGKLLFFLSAMEYLWQNGFCNMSRPFRNNKGKLYITHGSDLYFLTEWIEGKYIDFSQGEQLDAAVNLLADLHRFGEGFDPPKDCLTRNDLGRWPSKWKQRITDLKIMAELSQGQKDDFDLTFSKIVDISLEDAYQALDIIESAGYLEYCRGLSNLKPICHRDFVYHNLIFNGSGAFLIDFEYCIQDSRVIDLARFIRTTFNEHPWEVETAQRIITGYQVRYPLNFTEEKLLLAVLMFPHDIWRTGHKWYFSGQKRKSSYHFLCQQCKFYNHKYQVWRKFKQGFLSQ